MKHYFSDVRLMSDEELKLLSEEIEEHYDVHQSEDSYLPQDDEAERRYMEMCRELRDRWWNGLTAEQKVEYWHKTAALTKDALLVLSSKLVMAKMVNREYDREFGSKIGQSIQVRRPTRYGEE